MNSERKKELIKQITDYKINVTTVRDWNVTAKEEKLPSISTLINEFGSWKAF